MFNIMKHIEQVGDQFQDIEESTFNVFKVAQCTGRDQYLSSITVYVMNKLDLQNIVVQDKLASFLDTAQATYKQDVQYHNDLHGADVMQMAYRFLTKGKLQ